MKETRKPPTYPQPKGADVSPTHGHFISVDTRTGKASVRGVDFGPRLTFHGENKDYLILKMGGHNAWCGRGQTAYYGTKFIVYRIISCVGSKDRLCTNEYRVEPLLDFDLKQQEVKS